MCGKVYCLKNLWGFILSNKDWIFNGIGVAIVIFIISIVTKAFKRNSKNEQTVSMHQEAGNNSTNLLAAGDIFYIQGMSSTEVKQAVSDALEANFRALPEIALKIEKMPDELKPHKGKIQPDWIHHPDTTHLAFAILIGAWNENNRGDIASVTQLLGISYVEWRQKAREILHYPASPLSLKSGIWKVKNRTELWNLLSSRIFDQHLDVFKSIAVSVLDSVDMRST